MSKETVTIVVDVLKETDAAILVSDSATEAWIPLSQIKGNIPESGDSAVEIEIPEWLAEAKGFI